MQSRSSVLCPVFGAPEELSSRVLPTYRDIMKYYFWVRNDCKLKLNNVNPSVSEVADKVAERIEEIWHTASLPFVSRQRIIQMIRTYNEKYMNLKKYIKMKTLSTATLEIKLQTFQKDSQKLFDISSCKCVSFDKCSCPKPKKIPEMERTFLIDQRTLRQMCIGAVDLKTTEKQIKRSHRKQKEAEAMSHKKNISASATPSRLIFSDSDSDMDRQNSDTDTDYFKPSTSTSMLTKSGGKKRSRSRQYAALAIACDRTGVSDRSGAIIASAVLEDLGMITETDTSNVVDRSKVRRERKKVRAEYQQGNKVQLEPLKGLYFDGRKDQTLMQEFVEGKMYQKTVLEEHVTLIKEPGSTYLGHITPTSSSALSIYQMILQFIENKNIDFHQLVAIGCDGTVVNTGYKTGVVRRLEEAIGKPLHWFICQLHANELPLRHLVQHLDGGTAGPNRFSGPIGKAMANCENLPVIKFAAISNEFPKIDIEVIKDLSTDQRYLWDICQAVTNGNCSTSLSKKHPGKMSHARWITTANRIMRLYISTLEPSNKLQTLAEFIMKVYAPMWFTIKLNPYCTDGPRNLWKTINVSRYLKDELKTVVDPIIQRNGYFGHPETIILSMITDDRQPIREFGLRRILRARKEKKEGIRYYKIPPLNFKANSYIDLIDWQKCTLTEPPLTTDLTEGDLKNLISSGESVVQHLENLKFPCHTQSVERFVKLVTEVSAAVCGENKRDGLIRTRTESRKIMPSFESKCEYRVRPE